MASCVQNNAAVAAAVLAVHSICMYETLST